METGAKRGVSESLVPESKESRLSRFLARRYAVPLVIAGAVTIVTVACLAPDILARWQLPRERDRTRARGEPATLTELALEMPPDDDNAAVLFGEVFKLIDAAQAGEPDYWGDFLREDEDDWLAHRADAAVVVKLHAKAMALARRAIARPRCVFDVDIEKGEMWDLPYGGFMNLSKLFAAEAILEAMRGAPLKAADNLRVVFLLANALRECDAVGAPVVHRAFRHGVDALRKAEGLSALGDGERQMLVRSLSSIDWRRAATESYIAERVLMIDASEAMVSQLGNGSGWLSRMILLGQSPLSQGEKLRAWRLYTELIEASKLPPWKARAAVGECYGGIVAIMPWLACQGCDEPWKEYYIPHVRAMAIRDAAVIGMSCELFRSGVGRYPAKLDELAPEILTTVPPDPFTGKPFKYELRDDGRAFIVYSVGCNLKDDGGVEHDHEKVPKKDDIPWEGKAREE